MSSVQDASRRGSGGYSTAGSSSTRSTTRVTRWVRRDKPSGLWWLPLLGLLGVLGYAWMAFAKGTIQQGVQRHTQTALAQAGHGWAQMAVSGQNVVLSGSPPSAQAGDEALAVARKAMCPTWTGLRTCAVDVSGKFSDVAAVPPAAPMPAAVPPAAEPAPVAQAAQQCETALAALLEGRKIEFATGKATVLATSNALLDEIAKAAKNCPGTLEVQGHTDSVGAAAMNKALSQARANAVAQALGRRGLDAARLKPTGYGPDKPIADNSTKEGKAKNRRIEFRVVAN
jgi:outer membrane protein OmpA-like peptidoglycan-associated protein